MQTTAFVAGPDDAPVAVIKDLARQIGFTPVLTYRGPADLELRLQAIPLCFVLFAPVDRLNRLKPIVEAIRASQEEKARYAPLVYFSESPSLDTIKACIGIGFDDIVTIPFTLRNVRDRLTRQLDRPLTYYGTDTYFGPDRRGRLPHEEGHTLRGTGGAHRRIEIMRTANGIRVLHDDLQVMV
jgi:hypothetical protein